MKRFILIVLILSATILAGVQYANASGLRDFQPNAYNAFSSEAELQNFLAQDTTNDMMFAGKSPESVCAVYGIELKLRARLSGYDIEVYPFTDKQLWAEIYPDKPFMKHLMNVAIVDNGPDATVYLIEPQTDQYWKLGDIR